VNAEENLLKKNQFWWLLNIAFQKKILTRV